MPVSNRDARTSTTTTGGGIRDGGNSKQGGDSLPPISRKFTKYVDYNFSAMTDTKGGFLSVEDDPFSKQMSAPSKPGAPEQEQKPAHMTGAEWERMQLIKKLQRNKAGPYEPGISVLTDKQGKESERKKCRECGSLEIDFVWEETFGCAVCGKCKERYPERYSLLTKTEAKEDYLLTDRTFFFLSLLFTYHGMGYDANVITKNKQPNSKTPNSSRTSPSPTRTNRTGTT